MKAAVGLLAVLLLLSSRSFGQAPQDQPTAAGVSVEAAPAVAFGPGAKLFLEPMDTFEELLAAAIVKKKVPVVLVHDRAQADFVLSGDARVHKPGFVKGLFVDPHGTANFEIKDVRTGNVVFTDVLKQPGSMMTVGQIYLSEADACAKHLKKALVKK